MQSESAQGESKTWGMILKGEAALKWAVTAARSVVATRKEEERQEIMAVWWFSGSYGTFTMFFRGIRNLVDHENTWRWRVHKGS